MQVEFKINTLSWLLCCHLLGPGFAFLCGRKGIGEVAYQAGLANRVLVELHCQKNERTKEQANKQGHLDIGQDDVPKDQRPGAAPCASGLPSPTLTTQG